MFAAVLNDLRQAGRVQISGDSVALTGHGPKLSQNERKLLDELIPIFRQAGIQSPSVEECQQRATKSQQSVAQLLALAAANGDLVEIAAGYYLHRDVDSQLQTQLRTQLGDGRGATLSEIRECWRPRASTPCRTANTWTASASPGATATDGSWPNRRFSEACGICVA